jgi:hypothetical protein
MHKNQPFGWFFDIPYQSHEATPPWPEQVPRRCWL